MKINATKQCFQGDNGRDEFQRESVASKVIALLTSPAEVSPMVIDGDWGTGKTEFCHKLINKLDEEYEGFHLVYIDAFKADHADNPLMTILAEVLRLLPEDDRQGFIKTALPVVRYGLKTLAKASVSHILRENADNLADGLEDHLQDAADKAIDASVTATLKDHEKAAENLTALQKALENLANEAPIVLFIDELDRCRPDFSVQMLEVMKHTFNVPGVQFVLITNTNQLKAAINHCYGKGVDAQRYLDKFLKFQFALPDLVYQQSRKDVLASIAHFDNLVKKSTVLEGIYSPHTHSILDFINSLINVKKLTLREVETFVRYLEIYQTLSNDGGISTRIVYGYRLLRAFGVFVFFMNPSVAKSISRYSSDASELASLLGVYEMPRLDLERKLPDEREVIAVRLAKRCRYNTAHFAPKDNSELDAWVGLYKRFFSEDFGRDVNGLDLVSDVIRTLSLSADHG